MATYAAGDADGIAGCVDDGWVLHEQDGSTTSRDEIVEITRSHAAAFPEKVVEYMQEVWDGKRVAHYVRFTLRHLGRYHDLAPTGKTVVLDEMIFHRLDGDRIAESWRMTYPDSVYAQLVDS